MKAQGTEVNDSGYLACTMEGCARTVTAQEEGVDWAGEGAMRRGQCPGEWLMWRKRT